MMPDTFIVQIYHRRTDKPGELVGIVERVGVGSKQSFKTARQLWAVLVEPPRPVTARKDRR